MPKFRKLPVAIEAEQFDGSQKSAERLSSLYASDVWPEFGDADGRWTGRLCVKTREGIVQADPGDWIITGIAGERYPCKPDIFAQIYEPAAQTSRPICPLCGTVMVPFRHELDDGSGWMIGWLCQCTVEMRDEVFGDEV